MMGHGSRATSNGRRFYPGMEHSFDIDIAAEYGVDGAIVVRHFVYWILKHRADDEKSSSKRHTHREKTWTYCSVKRLTQIWPYWSVKQVQIILAKLIEQGVLIRDRFPGGHTSTKWYAFVDEGRFLEIGRPSREEKRGKDPPNQFARKGKVVCPNGQSSLSKRVNYYNNKPNTNTIIGIENNCAEALRLDLKIAEKRKFFTEELNDIFHPTQAEAVTFGRITRHLVKLVQASKDISIFNDALEWARAAKASDVANKKGLFVEKIKQETGFKGQRQLLQKGFKR